MKKIFTAILNSAFLILNCTAQTNVSGFISANTTWNLAGSPYVVVGNALLSNGYTLTIDPGVVVKFNDSTALQIDGELHAIGTAANRITFTSNQTVPAAGDWAKIHFADTCVNAVFDANGNYLSGCIMKYCDVMYGGQLGYGEIHIQSSSPYFSQCRILNSAAHGIHCVGSTYVLDSSAVKNCLDYGLLFQQFFQNSCGLLIHGDTIENNKGGIILWAPGGCANSFIKIINNYFLGNNTNATIQTFNVSGEIISENNFLNNIGPAVIWFYNNGSTNYTITCNKFINNQAMTIRNDLEGGGIIKYNIFSGNTSGIYYTPTATAVDLFFENNYLFNNSSSSPCCRFARTSGTTLNTNLYITSNDFLNNTAPSVVYITGPNINNASLSFAKIKSNNFQNPNSQYELYNNIAYGSPNLYADSNYWGSTSTQHIDSVIYDYFDFANLSVVYYMEILTARLTIDTTCSAIITEIYSIENKFSSQIFPNPFTTTATIKFSRAVHAATLRIYNMYGQLITESSNINGESFHINAEHFRSGVYVYEVTEKEKKICGGKAVVY